MSQRFTVVIQNIIDFLLDHNLQKRPKIKDNPFLKQRLYFQHTNNTKPAAVYKGQSVCLQYIRLISPQLAATHKFKVKDNLLCKQQLYFNHTNNNKPVAVSQVYGVRLRNRWLWVRSPAATFQESYKDTSGSWFRSESKGESLEKDWAACVQLTKLETGCYCHVTATGALPCGNTITCLMTLRYD